MATYRVPVLQDFHWQPSVKDKDLSEQPGAGILKGDRYIVGAAASGHWTGEEKSIATATQANPTEAAHWIFDAPSEGWQCWVDDEDLYYQYDGTSWTAIDTSKINQNSSQIVLNDSDISSHTIQIASLESKQVADTGNISSHTIQIASLESMQVVDTGNISSHTIQISSLESKQTVDTAGISQNSSQIVLNDSDLSSQAVQIAANESNISSHTVQLTSAQDEGTYVSEYGAIEFTI